MTLLWNEKKPQLFWVMYKNQPLGSCCSHFVDCYRPRDEAEVRCLRLSSKVFETIIRGIWNYHQMCLKLSSDVFETIIRGCLLSLHHHLQHVLLSLSENKSFLSHSILIDSCVTAGGLTLTLTLALTLLGGFYPNAFWCIFFQHCTHTYTAFTFVAQFYFVDHAWYSPNFFNVILLHMIISHHHSVAFSSSNQP